MDNARLKAGIIEQADRATRQLMRARAIITTLRDATDEDEPTTTSDTSSLWFCYDAVIDMLDEIETAVDELRADGLRAALVPTDATGTAAAIMEGVERLPEKQRRILHSIVKGMTNDDRARLDGQSDTD